MNNFSIGVQGLASTHERFLAARVLPDTQLECPDARLRHPAAVAVVGAGLKNIFHQPALHPHKASHSVVRDCTRAWVLEWLSVVVQLCMPRTAESATLRVPVYRACLQWTRKQKLGGCVSMCAEGNEYPSEGGCAHSRCSVSQNSGLVVGDCLCPFAQ